MKKQYLMANFHLPQIVLFFLLLTGSVPAQSDMAFDMVKNEKQITILLRAARKMF